MGEHDLAIAGIGQRGAQLQRFQGLPFRHQSATDRHVIRHRVATHIRPLIVAWKALPITSAVDARMRMQEGA
jgi:hypothetical protein